MDLSFIDAIIFDNDGVLVDSEVIHVAVERELLSDIGLNYDLSTYVSRFVGLNNTDFHAALQDDYAEKYEAPFPSDFRERLDARAWPRLEAELQAIAGVIELVGVFTGRVAVASSASVERLHQKLKLTRLYDVFAPHVYSSDQVRSGKPAPDLFLHAAAQIGVPPSRCLVIEDSVHGVIAGRAANMVTAGFTGGGHTDPGHKDRLMQAGAHFCVGDHSELKSLL